MGKQFNAPIFSSLVTDHSSLLLGSQADFATVIALRPGTRLEQERSVLSHAGGAPRLARAVRKSQRHALALVRVAALPLGAQRREAFAPEGIQRGGEPGQRARKEPIAVRRGTAHRLEIGRRLPDAGARCV